MKTRTFVKIFATCILASLAVPASAAVTINITQVGSNVVVTSAGTLDLTGLTLSPLLFTSQAYLGGSPIFQVYAGPNGSVDVYSSLTVPSGISNNVSSAVGTSGTGDAFGVDENGVLAVPKGFTGGTLSNTATFNNWTFATLGLNSGQFVFTAPNDTITVNIGPVIPGVPEPSTWVMMILGFGAMGVLLRRRRPDRLSQAVHRHPTRNPTSRLSTHSLGT